jgi:uncharacterized protein
MKSICFDRLRTVSLASLLPMTVAFCAATSLRAADIPPTSSTAEPRTIQQQIELAAAYFTGHGVPQNEKLAAYWYERAADAGDPEAEKQIGYFYATGLGVPVDTARAVHWFQLAAASGSESAKVNLGVAYLRGVGVPQNVALGIQLFREAAERGSGLGACFLGEAYLLGIGVPQDKAIALRWYEKGVKLHEARAEFALGSLLAQNTAGGSSDLVRALDLLRKSADAGFVPSMHALGLFLVNQPSYAKSSDEALKLIQAADQAGYWRSTAVLAILERDGKMMPADLHNAYYHFRLATLEGGTATEFLANDLKLLATKLGEQDTATIDAQAAAWHQAHPLSLEFIYKGGENWKKFPAFALADPVAGSFAGRLIATKPN